MSSWRFILISPELLLKVLDFSVLVGGRFLSDSLLFSRSLFLGKLGKKVFFCK